MEHSSREVDEKQKVEKLNWTPIMETTLLDLLKEQVLICNKPESGFTRAQWTLIESKFKEKLGIQLDKAAFKNKLKGWKTTYKVVKEMQNRSDFGWDEAKQLVVADDIVWTNYLKSHKEAKKYWKKPIRHWHDICIIIGNDMTQGGNQVDFSDVQPIRWGDDELLNQDPTEDLHDDNSPNLVGDNSEADKQITSRANNSSPPPSVTQRKTKKKKLSEAYIIANSLNNLAAAVSSSKWEKKNEENITLRVKEVYEALNEIEDIEQEVRVSAYVSIISDKILTDAFLTMHKSDRACFVRMKYHPFTSK